MIFTLNRVVLCSWEDPSEGRSYFTKDSTTENLINLGGEEIDFRHEEQPEGTGLAYGRSAALDRLGWSLSHLVRLNCYSRGRASCP